MVTQTIRSIVFIGAGKGGVGKSSMTCLLAHAFTQLGLDVGILDADLYGPSIPELLGYDPALQLTERPDDKKFLQPFNLQRIAVMSAGLFQNQRPVVVRAPVANALLEEMFFKTSWGALDVLFIDLPPGTGDIHLTLLQKIKATCAIIITTPQQISFQDTKKAAQMFAAMSVPICGVIENFSGMTNEHGMTLPLYDGNAGERIQKEFNIDLISKIPLDVVLSNQLDMGLNPLRDNSMSIVTKKIFSFAEELRDWMWMTSNPGGENTHDVLCTWE